MNQWTSTGISVWPSSTDRRLKKSLLPPRTLLRQSTKTLSFMRSCPPSLISIKIIMATSQQANLTTFLSCFTLSFKTRSFFPILRSSARSKTEFLLIIKDSETGSRMKYLSLIFPSLSTERLIPSSGRKLLCLKRKWQISRTKKNCLGRRFRRSKMFITQSSRVLRDQEDYRYLKELSLVTQDKPSQQRLWRRYKVLSRIANQLPQSSLVFQSLSQDQLHLSVVQERWG